MCVKAQSLCKLKVICHVIDIAVFIIDEFNIDEFNKPITTHRFILLVGSTAL